MCLEKLEVAQLRLWLLRLRQLVDVLGDQLQIFKVLVYKAVPQILLVRALPLITLLIHPAD